MLSVNGGGEEVSKCREWNDDLEPFGLRYAVWRLFLLQWFISFVRQGSVSILYDYIDTVRNSAYTLGVER
jgi:hypothetical protein